MVHKVEICKEDRGMVVLQSLEVSHLSNIPNRFYESPKLKNWMCELCTFLQIRSPILSSRGMVVLQYLEVSHLSNIPNRFYESPKLKN